MIAIARDRGADQGRANVDFVQAGVGDDFENAGNHDAVVAMNLLHLLPDTAEAAAKVHDLLRPGGVFISKTLCRPQGAWPWKLGLMRAALPVLQLLGKAPMVRFMSVQQLEAAITGAGFEIIETGNYPAEPPRRFIVARKL